MCSSDLVLEANSVAEAVAAAFAGIEPPALRHLVEVPVRNAPGKLVE